MNALSFYRERYRKNLLESVVPFWEKYSIDREFGGFFTCLDREGQVYDSRKYIWLQGRAVWMFSRLYREVERREEWLDAAGKGLAFLRSHAFDEQGRCYFSLTREGLPAGQQRKPYGAVFIALGLLEYSKAVGDAQIRQEGIDLVWKIKRWIEEPSLLGRPVLRGAAPVSKLADVMVMMMLVLELLEIEESEIYTGLLDGYIAAARKHLFVKKSVFMEQVSAEGRFDLDSPEGRLLNPGHSIEMCWFLLLALRRRPNEKLQREVLRALQGSLEAGWDKEFGGLYYFMDIEGKPPLALEHNMKLWWPHTEAIYAVVLAYSITEDAVWLDWLERIDRYSFTHFVDREHGEWFGYCDRSGNLTNTCKGNHYKGFFHVPRALLFSVQEMDRFMASEASAAGKSSRGAPRIHDMD